MLTYRTSDGDTLDWICHKHYGRADAVTTVLEANPGLAAMGPVYPAGLIIRLPELPTAKTKTLIHLWD